ncbi:unnamed protein product, partial [Didymodactylos carnosus]
EFSDDDGIYYPSPTSVSFQNKSSLVKSSNRSSQNSSSLISSLKESAITNKNEEVNSGKLKTITSEKRWKPSASSSISLSQRRKLSHQTLRSFLIRNSQIEEQQPGSVNINRKMTDNEQLNEGTTNSNSKRSSTELKREKSRSIQSFHHNKRNSSDDDEEPVSVDVDDGDTISTQAAPAATRLKKTHSKYLSRLNRKSQLSKSSSVSIKSYGNNNMPSDLNYTISTA